MIISILIIVAASYLLGNVNGAILISRSIVHDDVRRHGSGNAGFTNFFRNYGGMNSLLVLLIDFLKAVFACMIGRILLGKYGYAIEGATLGAVAVSLGHDFPALLHFKGGKGIICGFASAFVIDWRIAVVQITLFGLFYLITYYVSLGSIMGAAGMCISVFILHPDHPLVIIGIMVLGVLACYMHRENIIRLIRGTERKTSFFKKEKHQ